MHKFINFNAQTLFSSPLLVQDPPELFTVNPLQKLTIKNRSVQSKSSSSSHRIYHIYMRYPYTFTLVRHTISPLEAEHYLIIGRIIIL